MPIIPKKAVLDLAPYHRPSEGRYSHIRLDFNENTTGYPAAYPAGVPPVLISAYPEYEEFIVRLSKFYNIAADCILLTNGSDEGLMVTAVTFVEPGRDRALVSTPCFVMIPQVLKIAGAQLIQVPVLSDLSLDKGAIEKALESGVRIAMFDSPVNPTGALLESDVIERWCRDFPETLFVIDEAYGEYVQSMEVAETQCGARSTLQLISEFDNLLVVKTFSKAWGMAGLRLGLLFGQPQLIEYINRVKSPFSVNSLAVATAQNLLDRPDEVFAHVRETRKEKQALTQQLASRGFTARTGHANSILLEAGANAASLTDFCSARGVLIRNRSPQTLGSGEYQLDGKGSPMNGLVRVSIGCPEENKTFLKTLDSFCRTYGVIFDLDGTLVDTSTSFDTTIEQMVSRYSDEPLRPQELTRLRIEGGFNDDWVATHELLRRRGVEVSVEQIQAEAIPLYLTLAAEHETPLCDAKVLEKIASRYPIFIVTGRCREEYEPVWGDRLNGAFKRIYCWGDVPQALPKPAPDYLLQVIQDNDLHGGVYIGNSVDDVRAARDAGLHAIAVSTTQPADILREAGAQLVLDSVDQLTEVFML